MDAHAEIVDLRSERLTLRSMPPAAAACLPDDRDRAAELLGASLDDEWPLPDILDLMPSHAQAPPAEEHFGIWAVMEAATNRVVGDVGFIGPPSSEGIVEIGYSIVPSRRRRGYAAEAAATLVRWAFGLPGVTSIRAATDPDNVASHRVLERLGFKWAGASSTEITWRLDRDRPPR